MSLLQDIRRRLLGQEAMVMPGQGMGGATQGLIGTGGEMGGGLLQENFNKMNTEEGGLLSNIPQSVLLGAALYGQGMKGKDPLEGLFPALTQTAQLQKLMTPPKSQIQKLLESAGYKQGSEEYKAAVENYLNRNKSKNTLSQEALSLYKQGQAAPDFKKWFDGLNKVEQDLYNKQIKPNLNSLQAAFEFIEGQEDKLLSNAPKIPIVDGKPDLTNITEGIAYNNNGQLVVFDGEKFVSYKEYMSNR